MDVSSRLVYGFIVPEEAADAAGSHEAGIVKAGCRLVFHGDAVAGKVSVIVATGDEWSCDLTGVPCPVNHERMAAFPRPEWDHRLRQAKREMGARILGRHTPHIWIMVTNAT